jgi:hypothetical protein
MAKQGKAAKAGKPSSRSASGRKPNILVIWGDDIGQSNLSCYTHGLGAAMFAETFREFPLIQRPGSFTIDDAIAKMGDAAAGSS